MMKYVATVVILVVLASVGWVVWSAARLRAAEEARYAKFATKAINTLRTISMGLESYTAPGDYVTLREELYQSLITYATALGVRPGRPEGPEIAAAFALIVVFPTTGLSVLGFWLWRRKKESLRLLALAMAVLLMVCWLVGFGEAARHVAAGREATKTKTRMQLQQVASALQKYANLHAQSFPQEADWVRSLVDDKLITEEAVSLLEPFGRGKGDRPGMRDVAYSPELARGIAPGKRLLVAWQERACAAEPVKGGSLGAVRFAVFADGSVTLLREEEFPGLLRESVNCILPGW